MFQIIKLKRKLLKQYCKSKPVFSIIGGHSWIILLLTTFAFAIALTGFRGYIYNTDRGDNSNIVDYKVIMSDLNKAEVAADDIKLIELLRKYYIEPPAIVPYNISNPNTRDPSPGQTQNVDKLLNKMRNGVFVDCGAHDGEHLPNSLFLELFRNWTGVLIEPNPATYRILKSKNRKSYTLNACLSRTPYPKRETFFIGENPVFGKIVEQFSNNYNMRNVYEKYIQTQCFPLYSVLLALKYPHVDYFSLDVEGAEPGVLEKIPWDKIDIELFSIEHNKWPGGKQDLKSYMRNKGYDFMTEINVRFARDLIFKKRNISKFSNAYQEKIGSVI